jgi:hypothetical protein
MMMRWRGETLTIFLVRVRVRVQQLIALENITAASLSDFVATHFVLGAAKRRKYALLVAGAGASTPAVPTMISGEFVVSSGDRGPGSPCPLEEPTPRAAFC